MIEPEYAVSDLPELDRTQDPRGGGAAWALLTVFVTVFVTMVAGIALSATLL
ncbi:MAG: hypothetical protein ABIZ05_18635 [Pseudonocardiaceae bacterium]